MQGTVRLAFNKRGLQAIPRCCPNFLGRNICQAGRPDHCKPSWIFLSQRSSAARCSPDVPPQVTTLANCLQLLVQVQDYTYVVVPC